jgi:hypothetical protein
VRRTESHYGEGYLSFEDTSGFGPVGHSKTRHLEWKAVWVFDNQVERASREMKCSGKRSSDLTK